MVFFLFQDFAENTMNELLGWYGYEGVDTCDTQNLNLRRFGNNSDRSPATPSSGVSVCETASNAGSENSQQEKSGKFSVLREQHIYKYYLYLEYCVSLSSKGIIGLWYYVWVLSVHYKGNMMNNVHPALMLFWWIWAICRIADVLHVFAQHLRSKWDHYTHDLKMKWIHIVFWGQCGYFITFLTCKRRRHNVIYRHGRKF